MFRHVRAVTLLLAVASMTCAGCQSPTEPTDLDYFEVTAPDSVSASGPSGRTYTIPATDTEPSKTKEYPWVARITVSIRITPDASNKDGKLEFPVKITGTDRSVSPASGGIVVPPPTGTQVYHEIVPFANNNVFNAVNDVINITYDVYYDLPGGGREALVTLNFSFLDDDNNSLSESKQIKVNP